MPLVKFVLFKNCLKSLSHYGCSAAIMTAAYCIRVWQWNNGYYTL